MNKQTSHYRQIYITTQQDTQRESKHQMKDDTQNSQYDYYTNSIKNKYGHTNKEAYKLIANTTGSPSQTVTVFLKLQEGKTVEELLREDIITDTQYERIVTKIIRAE